MIDEMVVKNCKRRLTLLGIEWIDYRKVYDMVRHSWILKQIETLAVTGNVRGLITESMQNWNKKLITGGQSLGNVKIRQGIFQRNSLSPLLLLLTMIPLTLLLGKTKIPYQLKK